MPYIKVQEELINLDYILKIVKFDSGNDKDFVINFYQDNGSSGSVYSLKFNNKEDRDKMFSEIEKLVEPINFEI